MNINLLTIDSALASTTGTSPVASKPDEIRKGSQFSLNTDDKYSQANSPEKPTADNINEEIRNPKEPISKSPHESTKSIRNRTKSENPDDSENTTKSKDKSKASGTTKPPNEHQNLIKSWLAEHFIAAEQNKEGPAAKIGLKTGQQLALIIANTQTGKSPTVTGKAIKSAEIKLLHTTEKGQLGIRTVLPAKSKGQNGLKGIPLAISKTFFETGKQPGIGKNSKQVSVQAQTIAAAKSVTEKARTKESIPEFPVNTGKSTNTASGKIPAINNNPSALQNKASQPQPQAVAIEPEQSTQKQKTQAKITDSQTISRLLNPNGKLAAHTVNNLQENQSVQKLNVAAAQVSTGQTKDQGASTSNKNAHQGFEQAISHNTAQSLITEQSPAIAKNPATANMPGRKTSNEFSEDIGKQILESIQRSVTRQGVGRQVTVRLNPPELGKVFIRFRQQDAELTGVMEVSKPQTRSEIEQTLPQIIRNLADSGIQIKRLEVMLSNEEQPGQGTLGNQSMQSGGAHQHNSANPGTHGNNPDVDEGNKWLASNNGYENLYELQEAYITDGSINLLI